MDEETIKNNEMVAAAWYPIRSALENYDGQLAMTQLQAARNSSLKAWNGCYWKVEAWFKDWFRTRAPVDEKFPLDDFASDDFVRFIIKLYPNRQPAKWETDDLPHMMHELREYGATLDSARRRASAGRNG